MNKSEEYEWKAFFYRRLNIKVCDFTSKQVLTKAPLKGALKDKCSGNSKTQ